jgi:hypothetical protein
MLNLHIIVCCLYFAYNKLLVSETVENIGISKDLEKIIKEGFLEKRFRYFKSWRKYLLVLIKTLICFNTFYPPHFQIEKGI